MIAPQGAAVHERHAHRGMRNASARTLTQLLQSGHAEGHQQSGKGNSNKGSSLAWKMEATPSTLPVAPTPTSTRATALSNDSRQLAGRPSNVSRVGALGMRRAAALVRSHQRGRGSSHPPLAALLVGMPGTGAKRRR
eukprot:scaffold13881_cov124-Isochrysis_galbana.AAC.6